MDEKDLMLIESIVNEYLETDFEWLKSQATIDSLIDLKDRLEDQTDILTKEMDEIALELNHYFSQIYGPKIVINDTFKWDQNSPMFGVPLPIERIKLYGSSNDKLKKHEKRLLHKDKAKSLLAHPLTQTTNGYNVFKKPLNQDNGPPSKRQCIAMVPSPTPLTFKLADSSEILKYKEAIEEAENFLDHNKAIFLENEEDIIEIDQKKTAIKVNHNSQNNAVKKRLIKVGDFVYAPKLTTSSKCEWKKAQVMNIFILGDKPIKYAVKFLENSMISQLHASRVADGETSSTLLPVGVRVVSYYRRNPNDALSDCRLYSGIIAEQPKATNGSHYLIFFDFGAECYVSFDEVFIILHPRAAGALSDSDEDPLHAKFIENYLKNYPERVMLKFQHNQKVKIRENKPSSTTWITGRVIDLNATLANFYFEAQKISEWIYRGSIRLYPIYEELSRILQKPKNNSSTIHRGIVRRRVTQQLSHRATRPILQYTDADSDVSMNQDEKFIQIVEEEKPRVQIAKKSTTQTKKSNSNSVATNIESVTSAKFQCILTTKPKLERRPYKFVSHNCFKTCLTGINEDRDLKGETPYAIPTILGWEREFGIYYNCERKRRHVYYITPCGKRLSKIEQIVDYLDQTSSKLTIDLFTFSENIRLFVNHNPLDCNYYDKDISKGREYQPISVVNTVDEMVLDEQYSYSHERFPGDGVNLNLDQEFLSCCDCIDDCRDRFNCSCQQMTMEATEATYPQRQDVGYRYKRLDSFVISGIYECNPRCKCSEHCPNRVVQLGIKNKLQLFKTLKKGWGVRTLNDIPKGSFICTYSAHVLNENEANADGTSWGDQYLADLDYIDVCEECKEGFESAPEEEISSDEEYVAHRDDDNGYDSETERMNKQIRLSMQVLEEEDEEEKATRVTRSTKENAMKKLQQERKENRKTFMPIRQYFGETYNYTLDARWRGNIGRFFNHSCSPNLFVQNVFIDTHDLRFPWVAFFASVDIPAFHEIHWNYNYEIDSVDGQKLKCFCGSSDCRGRLL